MFFGSTDGLLHFFPDSIRDNPFIPPVVLTDFQVFNKSVPIAVDDESFEHDRTLAKSICEAEEIVMSHRANVFTFDFAALHYAAPSKNQYAYRMTGFDRDWIYSGNRHSATYTNLDPGEYLFQVKGSNSDELWNEQGTSIRITILPPWWRSGWAYGLYGVLIVAMLYGIRRFEMNRIKMRNQLRMREFEAQKLHEVDHLKSRFFANISHEFRTPLTLILGPLQDMVAKTEDPAARDELRMMQSNASRLLRLINQLLDLSRLETGRMPLRARRGNRDYIEIRVHDTGVGIGADRLPYIFDRFYQVENGLARTREGAGIGLALTICLCHLPSASAPGRLIPEAVSI